MFFFLIFTIITLIIIIFVLSFFKSRSQQQHKETFQQTETTKNVYGNFEIEQVIILNKGSRYENMKIEYNNATINFIKGNPDFCGKSGCKQMSLNMTNQNNVKETFIQLDAAIHPEPARNAYSAIINTQNKNNAMIKNANKPLKITPIDANSITNSAQTKVKQHEAQSRIEQQSYNKLSDDLVVQQTKREEQLTQHEELGQTQLKSQQDKLLDDLNTHQETYVKEMEKKNDVEDVSITDAYIGNGGNIKEQFQSDMNKQLSLRYVIKIPFSVSNKTTYKEIRDLLFNGDLKGKMYLYVEDTFKEYFNMEICDRQNVCTQFNRNSTVIDISNRISYINIVPT
jgi:hypothetical protein